MGTTARHDGHGWTAVMGTTARHDGHDDPPDAAQRHPSHRLVDRRYHRAAPDRESERLLQETVVGKRPALGLIPRLKVPPLVADGDARPLEAHLVADLWRGASPELVIFELQASRAQLEIGEEGLALAGAVEPRHSHGLLERARTLRWQQHGAEPGHRSRSAS
jgi:hypothetical protein